jgi:hypothetical protein
MSVNPRQALENIMENPDATNSEKINAAKALAQIDARENQAGTGSVSQMSRSEIHSELRRCKKLLDNNAL